MQVKYSPKVHFNNSYKRRKEKKIIKKGGEGDLRDLYCTQRYVSRISSHFSAARIGDRWGTHRTYTGFWVVLFCMLYSQWWVMPMGWRRKTNQNNRGSLRFAGGRRELPWAGAPALRSREGGAVFLRVRPPRLAAGSGSQEKSFGFPHPRALPGPAQLSLSRSRRRRRRPASGSAAAGQWRGGGAAEPPPAPRRWARERRRCAPPPGGRGERHSHPRAGSPAAPPRGRPGGPRLGRCRAALSTPAGCSRVSPEDPSQLPAPAAGGRERELRRALTLRRAPGRRHVGRERLEVTVGAGGCSARCSRRGEVSQLCGRCALAPPLLPGCPPLPSKLCAAATAVPQPLRRLLRLPRTPPGRPCPGARPDGVGARCLCGWRQRCRGTGP